MRIRPIQDKIVVRPDEVSNTSTGGIVLTSTDTAEQCQGTVVAAGPGGFDENGVRQPMPVSEGDRIVYNKHANDRSTVNVTGEELVIITEDAIFAIIK